MVILSPRPSPTEGAERDVLKVIVVGAGLAGIGAAIALRLASHEVIILESAREIGEAGAGIQCLPNGTRVLRSWGLDDQLCQEALCMSRCNIVGWRGNLISYMDFKQASDEYGAPFWGFHRADLHKALLDRALELGAQLVLNSEVTNTRFDERKSRAIVSTRGQPDREADLVVGADGIHSRCREVLLGRTEPPKRTGDMAYRIVLDACDILADEELQPILQDKAVNYWYGPSGHVATYPLRDGSLLNMVLIVPDDMPEDGPSTLKGYVDEMQGLFKAWDHRISKLLAMCKSVLRWRLCIRESIKTWVHPSGCFVLLGDSAHATLPYLASGASMCFEDGAVLGECLSRLRSNTPDEKRKALQVYETCRKLRTETAVLRGTAQQILNHLDDGQKQEDRDKKMKMFEAIEVEMKKGTKVPLPAELQAVQDPLAWRRYGAGDWLFQYDCRDDVEAVWSRV